MQISDEDWKAEYNRDLKEYREKFPEKLITTFEEARDAIAFIRYDRFLAQEEETILIGKDHVPHDWVEVLCDDVALCGDSHHFLYYLCQKCGKQVQEGSHYWRMNPKFTGKFFGDCPGERVG